MQYRTKENLKEEIRGYKLGKLVCNGMNKMFHNQTENCN